MPAKVLVAIPAHNEEASIGAIIDEARKALPEFDILVIDDASADATRRIAREHAALVIGLPFNLGIAGARQAGHRFAYEMGYDYLLQLDADGQHDPSYAMDLLKPVMSGSADLAIGSRFIKETGYKVPCLRRLGIAFLAWLISLLTKKKITDPTSGFHAINRKVISLYRKHYPYEYPEPEEIVLLRRFGYNVVEIGVSMRERERGKSFVTPLISVYYMFEAVVAIIMAYIRKYPSLGEGKR
jgi:glycosyltransferase involved in cell wall biosynthesis